MFDIILQLFARQLLYGNGMSFDLALDLSGIEDIFVFLKVILKISTLLLTTILTYHLLFARLLVYGIGMAFDLALDLSGIEDIFGFLKVILKISTLLLTTILTYHLFEPSSPIPAYYLTIREKPFNYISYKLFTYRIYRYYCLGILYWLYLWLVLRISTSFLFNLYIQLLTFFMTGLILTIPLTKEFSTDYSKYRILNSISICLYLQCIDYYLPVKEWPGSILKLINYILSYILNNKYHSFYKRNNLC
jgi:hypothetical protein